MSGSAFRLHEFFCCGPDPAIWDSLIDQLVEARIKSPRPELISFGANWLLSVFGANWLLSDRFEYLGTGTFV
jgi:hypothetical protein